MASTELKFDEIGFWSECKLDIVKRYGKEYCQILLAQVPKLHPIYIDGFAGAGHHISASTGKLVEGSPICALDLPFEEWFLIDEDQTKCEELQRRAGGKSSVHIFCGDCNEILLRDVLPKIEYRQYHRALCLLDPYGLDLNWEVVYTAGQSRTIDLFLNFPVMDMNRNVFWHNPEKVSPEDIARMNRFWGDDSWRQVVYASEDTLFGLWPKKASNPVIVDAFRKRLHEVAGFAEIAEPMPMRNSKRAIVYYLVFAAQKNVAPKIVNSIFRKYGKPRPEQ